MALSASHSDANNGVPLGGELVPSSLGEVFLADRVMEGRIETGLKL
jgi:hypothetical protein